MSSSVSVYSYSHSVTYVTDQMLRSLKKIIGWVGLDPAKMTSDWTVLEHGIGIWLRSRDLKRLRLEVYDPKTDDFVGGWDFVIDYGYGTGEGEMWADTEQIRLSILKCGVHPSSCNYRVVATTEDGRPDVAGWSNTTLRSTDGFIYQAVGTTIGSHAIGAESGYWRKI